MMNLTEYRRTSNHLADFLPLGGARRLRHRPQLRLARRQGPRGFAAGSRQRRGGRAGRGRRAS
jgi:hypothetical protein